MKPLRIDGETRELALDQPEFEPLTIRDEPVVVDVPDGPQTINGMTSAWQPTPDELERLKAGAPVYLQILGVRWPPVNLWVGEADDRPRRGDLFELRTAHPGSAFGRFTNLAVWYGPKAVAHGQETIASAVFAIGSDRAVYAVQLPPAADL